MWLVTTSLMIKPHNKTENKTMKAVQLKEVKQGEFIKRKPDSNKVYVRGVYDREFKKYRCDDFDDISRDIMLKGSTIVYVGFSF
jgi:hypothetical protein